MKIIHTSDWHLGPQFGPVTLRSDQEVSASWFAEIAHEQEADLIVIAGDLPRCARRSPARSPGPRVSETGCGISKHDRASVDTYQLKATNHTSPALSLDAWKPTPSQVVKPEHRDGATP